MAKIKIKHLGVLILLASAVFVYGAKPSAGTALDRSTAELTASLLLEKLQADILGGQPDSELLFHEMATHPAKYITPEPTRKKLETIFREGLSIRYHDAACKYLDRLAGEVGRDAFFSGTFLKEALELPGHSLTETVYKTYPGAFDVARILVCREQAKTLIASIRPSEAEFEDNSRETLSATLTTRIAEAQEQPVFQENLAYISEKFVKPMLDEAERQREIQRNFIGSQLVDGWAPDVIALALRDGLVKLVQTSAQRYEGEGRIAYGVFPSVLTAITDSATKRAADKVKRVVDKKDVDVDLSRIQEAIERDPEAHRTAAASMKAFSPQLETQLVEAVLADCEKLVPADEWKSFETFGRESFKDGPIRAAVIHRVRKELLPKVDGVRQAVAHRQVAEYFSNLMTQSWCPSGALVDDIFARVDYQKAVKAWREMSEMAVYAQLVSELSLLEESERMLDTVIVTLFERGRMAQSRQHGIVNDVFSEIKDAIGVERELPGLAAAVDRYTRKVEAIWAIDRDGVLWSELDLPRPHNADEQHVALFPSTEERILLKVKSLMESLERERQEREATPEIPPEEEIPPDKSDADAATSEKPALIELDCRFELDQQGSDIQLAFYVSDKRVAVLACSHSPRRYRREYAQTVEQAVSALIREMTGYTFAGSRVTLAVDIIVKNDLVYYGIVARLADALNEKTGLLSETGVELNLAPSILER